MGLHAAGPVTCVLTPGTCVMRSEMCAYQDSHSRNSACMLRLLTNVSTATTMPTISSLLTFMARPKAWWGALFAQAARPDPSSHQQAGRLRTADNLAAAVGNEVGAEGDIRVRNDQIVGRGINKDRHAGFLRNRSDFGRARSVSFRNAIPGSESSLSVDPEPIRAPRPSPPR